MTQKDSSHHPLKCNIVFILLAYILVKVHLVFVVYNFPQPSQAIAQQLISIMLVCARVSAVQIAIVKEIKSAVVMAVGASAVLQYMKVN